MASAYYANKNDLAFKIFESSKFIGGNCRTLEINEFKIDTGAHRFHDKIPNVTNEIKKIMGNQLLKVSSPSKIFHDNELINFPLQSIDIFKFLDFNTKLKIIKETIQNKIYSTKNYTNFKEFAYGTYGKTISELFLVNYTEKLWGRSANKLSSEISGNRLKNLTPLNLIKEMIYANNNSNHLDGSFYYPKNGYGTIFTQIQNIIGNENINFLSPITEIIHENNKIKHIKYGNNKTVPVNTIINTLPITSIIKILKPSPSNKIIKIINKFKFRSLKLFIIMLNKPYMTKNASIYFPEKEIPFTRIYESKNRSKYLAPENHTSIVIEIPHEEKITNEQNDENKMELIQSYLIKNNFFNKKNIISHKIINIPYAYPVLETGTNNEINILIDYLKKFKNMYLVGRNASFKYLHTHDLFHQSEAIINTIIKKELKSG
tara:strand:- start:2099 stop:3394 length:1296 start_codon:yes stop_codon:yes gene_type:complete